MSTSVADRLELHPDDLEDLRRSGLSDDTIAQMGCYSAPTDDIQERTGGKVNSGGYCIPYPGVIDQTGAPYGRWRLRKPVDDKKYAGGVGDDPQLYIPPALSALSPSDFLLITEGEKKAARAVQEGIHCVGIQGVWNWADPDHRAREKLRNEAVSEETSPLPDLLHIASKYERVLVLGDSDLMSKPQGKSGLELLTRSLRSHSIRAEVAYCPPAVERDADEARLKKQGLDDWLVADRSNVIRSLPALFRAAEVNRVEITDNYNAQEIEQQLAKSIAYSREGWRWWSNPVWQADARGSRRSLVARIAESYREEAHRLSALAAKVEGPFRSEKQSDILAPILAWCGPVQQATKRLQDGAKKLGCQRGVDSALVLAQSGLYVEDDAWDRDPELLCVRNGVVNLRTGTLFAASPDQWLTKCAGAAYESEAMSPTWEHFLNRVQPNPEMRDFLQRLAGYSAIGTAHEQKFYIFVGEGQNGKGTFMGATSDALRAYCIKGSRGLIAEQAPDKPRNDIARLAGARLLSISENSQNLRFDIEMMKVLTGGDDVTARFLYQEHVQFRPVCTPILDTNYVPRIYDNGHAVWRRLSIVPWDVRIPEFEKDKELGVKLRAELPGILAWIIEGAKKYLETGLVEPTQVKEATRALRLSSDDLARWLEEFVVSEPGHRAHSTALFQSYMAWSRAQGVPNVLTHIEFSKTMETRGYEKGKSNGLSIWKNLRLRDHGDAPNRLTESSVVESPSESHFIAPGQEDAGPMPARQLTGGQYIV